MTLLRAAWRVLSTLRRRIDGDYVSAACLRQLNRADTRRGVDLPTWRTPREVAQMRRLERRAALRLAKGA